MSTPPPTAFPATLTTDRGRTPPQLAKLPTQKPDCLMSQTSPPLTQSRYNIPFALSHHKHRYPCCNIYGLHMPTTT